MRPLEGVRELRERRMLSQQELADRAGVSLFTIQRIERGEGNVRPKTGRAIAAALGVSVEDFSPKAQPELWEPSAATRPAWERPEEEFLAWLAEAPRGEVERVHREVSALLGDYQERYYSESAPTREALRPRTDSPEWRRLRLLHRREVQLQRWRKYLDERAPRDEAKLDEVRKVKVPA